MQASIKTFLNKIHPGVQKPVLLILAGLLWFASGTMLVTMAIIWLRNSSNEYVAWYAIGGIVAALLIHHFGFLRIVDKNLGRIRKIDGKYCAFGFMPLKSYILISVMMTMGILLKNSSLPKIYLSVLYLGIGAALILSSTRYFLNIRKCAEGK
jgi:hypothetical protein